MNGKPNPKPETRAKPRDPSLVKNEFLDRQEIAQPSTNRLNPSLKAHRDSAFAYEEYVNIDKQNGSVFELLLLLNPASNQTRWILAGTTKNMKPGRVATSLVLLDSSRRRNALMNYANAESMLIRGEVYDSGFQWVQRRGSRGDDENVWSSVKEGRVT